MLYFSERNCSYEIFERAFHFSVTPILKMIGLLAITLTLAVLVPSSFGISIGFFTIYKSILTVVFKCAAPDINQNEDVEITDTSLNFEQKQFDILDVSIFANSAAKAIIDDNVLKRFTAEELPTWNFMARTYMASSQDVGISFMIFWFIGTFYRYFIQFPCRLLLMTISLMFLLFSAIFINILPKKLKTIVARYVNIIFCRISLGALGIFADSQDLYFHLYSRHNLPKHGVCVSNHTSPIDVLVLGSLNQYRFIGQAQPGFFAILQKYLTNLGHVFFERSANSDRRTVSECIKNHCKDPSLPPVIIFPEGTCINNTGVMQFRKGTFEVCDTVYPVAIKYNPLFGDAFWNSSKESYGWYIISVASSWFLYCDVWYLPPVTRTLNESAISFASRVQKAIALKANIVDLNWDGNLKRTFVPHYITHNIQNKYAESIIFPSQ